MKKQSTWWRKWLTWLLFVIGVLCCLALIFNQQIKYYLVGSFQPRITAQTIAKNNQTEGTYDFQNVKDLTLQTAAKARANKEKIHIIGVIGVPDDQVRLPIAKGTSNLTLALAAGTMRPDQQMGEGNYPLAAHNMMNLGTKVLFTPLYYHAKVGQLVYITDMKHIYEYKLYERTLIDPSDVSVINNTPDKIITLITCGDASASDRLLLRGNLVKTYTYSEAPVKIQKYLSGAYTNGQE